MVLASSKASLKPIPAANLGFEGALGKAKTIVWYGAIGTFVMDKFVAGNKAIAQKLAQLTDKCVITIIMGETVKAVKKFGMADKMTHVCVESHTSLKLLQGESVLGITNIAKSFLRTF